MSIFSFKQCGSESEARKAKIIYSVIFISLFLIANIIILKGMTILMPIYEGLGLKEGDFEMEKEFEKVKNFIRVIKPISILFQIFILYITIWASIKLGMGKIPSILWGIVALAPFVSLVPFIVILTRKQVIKSIVQEEFK